jgi:choline-glycine betaine transporter
MASIAAGLPIAMLLLVMSYTLIHSLRKEMPSLPAWAPTAGVLPEVERRESESAVVRVGSLAAAQA